MDEKAPYMPVFTSSQLLMIITVFVYSKKGFTFTVATRYIFFTFTVKPFHIYGALLQLALKVSHLPGLITFSHLGVRQGSDRMICLTVQCLASLDRDSPGRVGQSVTCLATDACLTADPGVASSIPVRSHTFVEIDHEMISTVILLPSADLFKKGCCQLKAKVCARITG